MTPPVSERQQQIVVFIAHATKCGYPPTIREIGEHVGLSSTSSVSYQIRQLVEKGLVRRSPARARGLVLTALARPLIVTRETL